MYGTSLLGLNYSARKPSTTELEAPECVTSRAPCQSNNARPFPLSQRLLHPTS